MTVQQMLNALPIVQKMMGLKLPIKKAYGVYFLAKQINEQREFFINEEKKLIEKFNAEVLDNGGIRFNSTEDQAGFVKEHTELMNYEVEVDSLELTFDDLKDAEFTASDLVQLDNVISFID